jgi:hypothetical protein
LVGDIEGEDVSIPSRDYGMKPLHFAATNLKGTEGVNALLAKTAAIESLDAG